MNVNTKWYRPRMKTPRWVFLQRPRGPAGPGVDTLPELRWWHLWGIRLSAQNRVIAASHPISSVQHGRLENLKPRKLAALSLDKLSASKQGLEPWRHPDLTGRPCVPHPHSCLGGYSEHCPVSPHWSCHCHLLLVKAIHLGFRFQAACFLKSFQPPCNTYSLWNLFLSPLT